MKKSHLTQQSLFISGTTAIKKDDSKKKTMYVKTLILCAAYASVALGLPASDKAGSENDLMASIYSDCIKKESISCIKYKVFSFVDKMLADKDDISISEGITVVKTTTNIEEGAPR